MKSDATHRQSLTTVGLFAGVGGIELGLSREDHSTVMLVEVDAAAQAVLKDGFPDIPIHSDIRTLNALPECDLVTAGFPCQNLSQCGKTEGIGGSQSSLVEEVFRLVETAQRKPKWILLENVPFMLSLERGRAMTLITTSLRRLGYNWAYRTIDARAFGVPQRRQRVVLLASAISDPRDVLFSDNEPTPNPSDTASAYGFYWTEGNRGLGWGVDCVPTLKGGSGLGIPSPPAIWIPEHRRLVTVEIRDAERLQGLPVDWTQAAGASSGRAGKRWRLVGNAVCTLMAEWIGKKLAITGKSSAATGDAIPAGGPWPSAAYGDGERAHAINATAWPIRAVPVPLLEFLKFTTPPLSARATAGFLSRAKESSLRFSAGFLKDVAFHLRTMETAAAKSRKRTG